MASSKSELVAQADRIMEIAENYGVEKNYLFMTTFQRLQDTIEILEMLMKEIKKSGTTVVKQYVKGRENTYTNPAIPEYNKTAKTFNDTVASLMKIIDGFKVEEDDAGEDPLTVAIRGE